MKINVSPHQRDMIVESLTLTGAVLNRLHSQTGDPEINQTANLVVDLVLAIAPSLRAVRSAAESAEDIVTALMTPAHVHGADNDPIPY
jgi:hypothetical protein